MGIDIRGVMGQSSQRKSVLIQIRCLANKVRDKFTAAHIMGEVAEELTAERVISDVLNQAATISEGVRGSKILCCGPAKPLLQDWLDIIFPCDVHDLLMSQK